MAREPPMKKKTPKGHNAREVKGKTSVQRAGRRLPSWWKNVETGLQIHQS